MMTHMRIVFSLLLLSFFVEAFGEPGGKKSPVARPPVTQKEEVSPELTCPDGFVLHGSECSGSTKQSPTFSCPAGFEKSYDKRNECVRKVTMPPVPYCEKGYEALNGVCSMTEEEPPEYFCPASYQLTSGDCIRSVVVNPGIECAEDFTLVGESCQRQIEMNPIEGCPEGHQYDKRSRRCVKLDSEKPYPVCPTGTLPRNGMCMEYLTANPVEECPPGYEQVDSKCLKEDVIKVTTSCEGDITPNQDDECVAERLLPAELACEDGFSLDPITGDCIIRREPKFVCPGGGTLNFVTNECEYKEAILPSFLCPDGYENRNDNECVKISVEDVLNSCPPGYTYNGSDCTKQESFLPEEECPDGFTLVENSCIRPSYKPMWQRCPNGFELSLGRCTTHEDTAPDLVCPPSFQLKGIKCVQERTVPVDSRCPPGTEKKVNKCIRVIEATAKEDCPAPYRYNPQTGHCEDEEVAPPEISCPKGFQFDKKKGGECVGTQTRPPIPRCPNGTVYDAYYRTCKVWKAQSKKPSVRHKAVAAPAPATYKNGQSPPSHSYKPYSKLSPSSHHSYTKPKVIPHDSSSNVHHYQYVPASHQTRHYSY